MSNIDNADVRKKLVSFRADDQLTAAMKKASQCQRVSVSDIIRQSVVETMRRSGLLEESA
jgi:hypothetical protein